MRRLTLLVNADDTLWESNVFFEKTLERFFSLVEPFGYARAYARHILNETERLNIRQHGYGVRSFGRTLEQSYLKLAGSLAQRSALQEVSAMVEELESTPPRVLDGVPETLAYLSGRHRMILFTKGEAAEEAAKVERSGLQGFFDAIEIVAENSAETYRRADRPPPRGEIARLDRRQPPECRHQYRLAGRTQRRFCPASRNLGSRERRTTKWHRPPANRHKFSRVAESLLKRHGLRRFSQLL